ncbi:MAG: VCBS repeat-containing protein [Planctomycetota bacterium]
MNGAWLAAWLLLAPSDGATFVESHLRLNNPIHSYQRADLNQDGREDLILVHCDDNHDRVLHIYYLQADQHYPTEASVRIPAKKDVIAYTVANVRSDPGLEIVFLTRSAAFSYSPTKPGYRDNIDRLFQADMVLDLPDPEDLPFLNIAGDLDGDGWGEIVLPVDGGFEIFGRTPAGAYQQADRIDLGSAAKPAMVKVQGNRRGFSFSLQSPNRSFLIDEREAGAGLFRDQFFQAGASVPVPRLYDIDGDRLRDVVIQRAAQLEIFAQGPGLSFPEQRHRVIDLPSYLKDADARGNVPHGLIPIDIDGDGLPDLVARGTPSSGFGGKEIIYNFYLNKGHGDVLREEPDYRLKFKGFDADLQLQDVDHDQRMDVLVNVWDAPIGPETAIAGVKIVLDTYLFMGVPGKLYERSPSLTLPATFRPDQIAKLERRGLHAGDFNGDGFMDLCGVGADGAVVITPLRRTTSLFGSASIEADPEPLYRYAADKKIQHLEVVDVNQDGIADLLVRFKNELAVLVSAGGRK